MIQSFLTEQWQCDLAIEIRETVHGPDLWGKDKKFRFG